VAQLAIDFVGLPHVDNHRSLVVRLSKQLPDKLRLELPDLVELGDGGELHGRVVGGRHIALERFHDLLRQGQAQVVHDVDVLIARFPA
jgi:hypothetical protein